MIDLSNNFYPYYTGAINFFQNKLQFNQTTNFIGAVIAYEFKFKDVTEITNRRKKERASINQVRDSLTQLLEESESQLSQHLKNANEDFKNYATQIDSFKNDKEKLFNDWFEKSSNYFQTFNESSKKSLAELESTYEELLRLKKPADYWNKRASRLKKEGWWSIGAILFLVLIATLSIYILLWHTPDGMLSDVFKDTAKAIKWSILYISFLTFFAFGIRALTKVAFSSFHLARDAEEREQLTYLYLSLLNESSVDDKDRSLILQSLFSRSDTGLLKEDSSPTMPNNFIEKLLAAIKKSS